MIQQFRQLFVDRPELTRDLKSAPSLDAAAEALDRIGARHGIATSAAEIRSHVRRLRQDYLADRELSSEQLDGIAAGAGSGGDLALMFASLGVAPGQTG
jgi:hypothetical protein